MSLAWGTIWLQVALAQDAGGDAHGFALAPQDGDPRGTMVVQRPSAFLAGDAFATALVEYARVDARLASQPDRIVLRDLTTLNLSAGIALFDRWRVDVRAPVFAWASGEDQPTTPALGDVRLTSMWLLARPRDRRDGLGIGLVGHVDAPTGAPARWLGQPSWAGGGRLALSVGAGAVGFSADAGVHMRSENSRATAGAAVSVGLGSSVGVTFETVATSRLAQLGTAESDLNVEAIGALRVVSQRGRAVTVGGAFGVVPDIGVPRARAFVGFGLARRRARARQDRDPILPLRSLDLCPMEVETVNGWRDDDGCPDRLGTLAVDVRFRDASRPANAEIVGPTETRRQRIGPQGLSLDVLPGTTWTVRATEGCLRGEARAVAKEEGATLVVELAPVYDASVTIEVRDGRGVPVPKAQVSWRSETPDCVPPAPMSVGEEARLQQALASGLHTLVVTAPGFDVYEQLVSVLPGSEETLQVALEPSRVVIQDHVIQVLEKLRFAESRAELLVSSQGLLDELAALLKATKGLGRVEIAGHTDSRGSEDFNQQLSQSRAESVRDYLVGQGVPADQLVAKGYGESDPVASNKTEAGREANRRVTFRLLDADPVSEAP
ncbi:MAG: OmpA family protein [Myxococcota bacterium]